MLFEQVIANNPSLQPYEYISTEITEDGKRPYKYMKNLKQNSLRI